MSSKALAITHEGDEEGEPYAWAKVRLVRSNHDMWTLEIGLVNYRHNVIQPTEHILIQGSQIDMFKEAGVPIKNPLPQQPPPKKGKKL